MRHLLCALLAVVATAQSAELARDERVIFFPTLGQRVQDGAAWELDVHGWMFEPEKRRARLAVFQAALGLKLEGLSAAEKTLFAERARWFLVDNERGQQLSIRVGDRTHRLKRSGPNGHFFDRVRIEANEIERLRAGIGDNRVFLRTVNAASAPHRRRAEVHLLEATGLSVISDLDDTIKVSQVTDREALLRNTFCRPLQAVPGMAALYRAWATNHGAQFHFVSASPWQLYPALADFAATNGFPAGSWHLKEFRWKDRSFFGLIASPDKYKLSLIEPLLERFPQRRFILVGDSGERDPEIYGTLARKCPRQIARIFIRDVTGEPAVAARYQRAFAEVPSAVWGIFRAPDDIREASPSAN
ncbi:MAG: DUF2183 domain-containing protein [Verrucomicrobia bacterium]|nr:DUF2183 domain-containing protein [Verrucomicrobiota bacterium]